MTVETEKDDDGIQRNRRRPLANIEDYAFIGDTHSAGLVSRQGSIDWLCLPRFDSGACFSAILDEKKGGRWSIRPRRENSISRAYRPDSMVLETTYETSAGKVKVTDCLALEHAQDVIDPRELRPQELVVRSVHGIAGSVAMEMEFTPRFDYGYVVPLIEETGEGKMQAVGGPDALTLSSGAELQVEAAGVFSRFDVRAGETVHFLAAYHPSHLQAPEFRLGAEQLIDRTDAFWKEWAGRCTYRGKWRDDVVRSLLTLKALTFSPTGGVVAAATTSLPEKLGGVRNWDYRYCWLRDATLTLEGLIEHGYKTEAREWEEWLLRAVAGDPEDFQIMYGPRGERRLPEQNLEWLSGYEGSTPVRTGNAAVGQFQLDVYGEVMDSFHSARREGIQVSQRAWNLQREIVNFVCKHWREPDEGIWEVRSGRQHFVQSKVMAWVALDRGVKAIEDFGREGPLERWKTEREEVHSEVLDRGFNPALGHFVRAYDETEVDASLLRLPLVGFISVKDPKMSATIEAIQKKLSEDGLLLRYRSHSAPDGLPAGEGAFLICSFWLVDCLSLAGKHEEAEAIFERLIGLCNDIGLLSEQYDPIQKRMLGNFPQAFSHIGLVTSAAALESRGEANALHRGD